VEGFELNVSIPTETENSCEKQLAEFLRTGRVAGGPECCAFLRDLFGDLRVGPTDLSR
jgi:hypothetical protein